MNDVKTANLKIPLKFLSNLRLLRQEGTAEDLTLCKEFPRYDHDRSFGAWARGIAAKKLMERWRKTSRLPIPFSPEALQSICDAYDRLECEPSPRADALRHCLERLPEKSRRLLVLRYEESGKLNDIARELQTSLDAVAQALSRLRSRLYDCITQWLAAQEVS
jgi:RNA polymerase sigma-70 factor (ECF subfamily)